MAVLGPRFCARAFSSCGKWGPLLIAVRGPLIIAVSRCGAQAPDAQAQQLWLTGLVAPRHVGSSQTRARTRVPCIGRQTPNHCTTREAQICNIFNVLTQCLGHNNCLECNILLLSTLTGRTMVQINQTISSETWD